MTVLIQHSALRADADQSSDGIEHIDKQKRKEHDNEVEDAHVLEADPEAFPESVAQSGKIKADDMLREEAHIAFRRIRDIDSEELADQSQDPGDDDAKKNRPAYVPDVQDRRDKNPGRCQYGAYPVSAEMIGEAGDRDQRR